LALSLCGVDFVKIDLLCLGRSVFHWLEFDGNQKSAQRQQQDTKADVNHASSIFNGNCNHRFEGRHDQRHHQYLGKLLLELIEVADIEKTASI
jgi:hypothetical protein